MRFSMKITCMLLYYFDHLYRNQPLFYCSFILSGCYDNTVNIWSTEGEKLLTIPGHSGPIKSVAWVSVSDGNSSFIRCVGGLIGMTMTNFSILYQVNYFRAVHRDMIFLPSLPIPCHPIPFHSGSHDQTLIIWSLDFGQKSVERMHVCRGHAGSVDAVCVSPDGSRFISGSWDKSLKIWSTSLEPEPGLFFRCVLTSLYEGLSVRPYVR